MITNDIVSSFVCLCMILKNEQIVVFLFLFVFGRYLDYYLASEQSRRTTTLPSTFESLPSLSRWYRMDVSHKFQQLRVCGCNK